MRPRPKARVTRPQRRGSAFLRQLRFSKGLAEGVLLPGDQVRHLKYHPGWLAVRDSGIAPLAIRMFIW